MSISDNETGVTVGYMNTSVVVGENKNDIYVYIPVVHDGVSLVDEPGLDIEEKDKITDALLTQCGWTYAANTEEQSC